MKNSWKPWLIVALSAVGFGALFLLWFFPIPQDENGLKTLTAVLGLVLPLVSLIINLAISERNRLLEAQAKEKNRIQEAQAEQRNRIETVLKAVDLLGENNQDAAPSKIGGTLLALVSLGELDLAVNLLAELWPKKKVSSIVAGAVLEAGLESAVEKTQISAAGVLLQNAAEIEQGQVNIWPVRGYAWKKDFWCDNCRLGLVWAAGEWLKTQVAANPNRLPGAVIVLYHALEDRDPTLVSFAADCLTPLVKVLPHQAVLFLSDGGSLSIGQIAARLAARGSLPPTDYGLQFKTELTALYAAQPPAAEG